MEISQNRLSKTLGVSPKFLRNIMKSLGITDLQLLSDKEYQALLDECKSASEVKESAKRKVKAAESSAFEATVRRIDQSQQSSIPDILEDCKERYVKNEELIQRLQYEIDNQDALMHGNKNGTISCLPQLNTMEKFQKININLRFQIVQLEKELGRVAKDDNSDDPFA